MYQEEKMDPGTLVLFLNTKYGKSILLKSASGDMTV